MNNQRGFTLIELMLGFIIFAIIGTSLFSVFHNGVMIQKRAQQVEHIAKEVRWTLDQLENDISKAVFYNFNNSYIDRISFKGTADSVSLIVFENNQLWWINYYLKEVDLTKVQTTIIGGVTYKPVGQTFISQEETTRYQLIRETQLFSDYLKDIDDDIEQEILCARLVSPGLTLSYADVVLDQNQAGDIQWQEQWDNNYFPQAVRVQLKYPSVQDQQPTLYQRHVLVPTNAYYHELYESSQTDAK